MSLEVLKSAARGAFGSVAFGFGSVAFGAAVLGAVLTMPADEPERASATEESPAHVAGCRLCRLPKRDDGGLPSKLGPGVFDDHVRAEGPLKLVK